MSKEIKKVRVKLTTACLIEGVEMRGGDIVALDETTASGEPHAAVFGEVQKDMKDADTKKGEEK